MVTTGARDSAGLPPTRIMQMDGISLLDPEEDEIARWALARIREQSAYAQLSERAWDPGEPRAQAAPDRAALDQLQTRLDEQVKEHFPDGGVQRIALLQHGDDPAVEPGDLLARACIEEAWKTRTCRPGTGTTRR